LGFHQKLYTWLQALVIGSGNCSVTTYANTTVQQTNPSNTYSIPGGLNLDANPNGAQDFGKPLNVIGERVFVEFATNAVGSNFALSKMILEGGKSTLRTRGNIM